MGSPTKTVLLPDESVGLGPIKIAAAPFFHFNRQMRLSLEAMVADHRRKHPGGPEPVVRTFQGKFDR